MTTNKWRTTLDPPPRWPRYLGACAIATLACGGVWLNSYEAAHSDRLTVAIEGQKVTIPAERDARDQRFVLPRRQLEELRDQQRLFDLAEVFEYAQQHPNEQVQIWPPVPSRCRSKPRDCWANQLSPFATP